MNTTPEVDPADFLAIQVSVLHAAVRALHATHLEPAKVEAAFQQLIGQMQANPAFLLSPPSAALLRRFSIGRFQPPVQL